MICMIDEYLASPEFKAISAFYRDRCAERSGVPLIRHIHEGRAIILAMGRELPNGRSFSIYGAVRGYTLHPLFQHDDELTTVGRDYVAVEQNDPFPVMLAMEYRARANAWLSEKVVKHERPLPYLTGEPDAGPLPEVHAMLIADKVQNRKDFLRYHKGTHARSDELDLYFKTWLEHLGVSDSLYEFLCAAADAA